MKEKSETDKIIQVNFSVKNKTFNSFYLQGKSCKLSEIYLHRIVMHSFILPRERIINLQSHFPVLWTEDELYTYDFHLRNHRLMSAFVRKKPNYQLQPFFIFTRAGKSMWEPHKMRGKIRIFSTITSCFLQNEKSCSPVLEMWLSSAAFPSRTRDRRQSEASHSLTEHLGRGAQEFSFLRQLCK